MEIKKITLEIPRCHNIVTAETSKSRKPKRNWRKCHWKCNQKHRKEQEQCLKTVYVILRRKKVHI
jgi:hypothetical protein